MNTNQKIWNIVYRFNDETLETLILKPNPEPGRSTDYYVITGAVEANELPIDAAKRETWEEIGVTPLSAIDLHKTIRYTDKFSNSEFIEHCFAIKVDDSPLTLNEEHIDYKWTQLEDFVNSIWWEGEKSELQDIVDAFRKIIA